MLAAEIAALCRKRAGSFFDRNLRLSIVGRRSCVEAARPLICSAVDQLAFADSVTAPIAHFVAFEVIDLI
jgi:hypothetical protein